MAKRLRCQKAMSAVVLNSELLSHLVESPLVIIVPSIKNEVGV